MLEDRPARLLGLALLAACSAPAERAPAIPATCAPITAESVLTRTLHRMHARNAVPGLSAALVFGDAPERVVTSSVGRVALASAARALTSDDRMLAGSVGKTFWAALALRRASTGALDLDAPVRQVLPAARIPSFAWITPRMLLRHTSGIGEYDRVFMTSLVREPQRVRTWDDWLGVLRRQPPPARDTGRFRYSDLNYVVLAMLLDGGEPGRAYRDIETELLRPLQLDGTVPALTSRIPGLVAGHDGATGLFGRDVMLDGDTLVYNPQFEWGGGGFASTPRDLARWMMALRLGRAFPDSLWAMVVARPPGVSDTAQHWRGMGVHVDLGPLGAMYGHSGYMPGYVSWMRWYERDRVAVSLQANAVDSVRLSDDGFAWTDSVVVALRAACRR